MGHHIHVFLATAKVLQCLAGDHSHSRVIPLSQGVALMPLTDRFLEEIHRAPVEELSSIYSHFEFLTQALEGLALEHSRNGIIAYFETDYSGTGGQSAIVWENGRVRFGPEKSNHQDWTDWVPERDLPNEPINRALRLFGVHKSHQIDEFDAVGLGMQRSDDDWVSFRPPPK